MRIAVVYRHFNLTGSLPRSTVELSQGLSSRGHEVHVFAIAETRDASLAPDCIFHDVPVTAVVPGKFSPRELISFARNAARLLERESFDVVHTRLPSTWTADILHFPGVTRATRHSGISTAHWFGSQVRHPGNLARTVIEYRAIHRRPFRFHAVSPMVRDDLVHYYGVEVDDICVVPPGVNLREFQPGDRLEARRELQLPPGETLVLFCGHDFERKGLDRALEAVTLMSETATLIVVGNGDSASYAALAGRLGVPVKFVGGRSDAAAFFRAADILVLPTREDMWGAPVIEAMASGVPPIVTANAGAADLVRHGETGFIISERFDARELATILDELARSPELRARIGGAGVASARSSSWEVHVDRVEDEMNRVAEMKRTAAKLFSAPVR